MEHRRKAASPPDFSRLDFERLWRHRAKTTQVEAGVLEAALQGVDTSRMLEVGSGGGRLTPTLRAAAHEFVAADVTRAFVERLDHRSFDRPAAFRSVANVYRLPFADSTFTAAAMVRVYNFLEYPVAALQELRRVLVPGGCLVVSYEPRPSIGTLVSDVRMGLASQSTSGSSTTFSRADLVEVRPSSFPAWAPTRARFARTLEAAGFRAVREFPTGLEDYRPFKWLPAPVFQTLAETYGGRLGGVFPSRFQLARAFGPQGSAPPVEDLATAIACPDCGSRAGPVDLESDWNHRCPGCGFLLQFRAGILDAASAETGPRAMTIEEREPAVAAASAGVGG